MLEWVLDQSVRSRSDSLMECSAIGGLILIPVDYNRKQVKKSTVQCTVMLGFLNNQYGVLKLAHLSHYYLVRVNVGFPFPPQTLHFIVLSWHYLKWSQSHRASEETPLKYQLPSLPLLPSLPFPLDFAPLSLSPSPISSLSTSRSLRGRGHREAALKTSRMRGGRWASSYPWRISAF